MYPKKKIERIVHSYLPKIISDLKITEPVNVLVMHSESKKTIDQYGRNEIKLAGICFHPKNKTHEIHLFYDVIADREEALATLIHECLHARFRCLEKLCPPKHEKKWNYREEHFVRGIEKLVMRGWK